MNDHYNLEVVDKKIDYVAVSAYIVVFMGCVVFLGWIFNLEFFKTFLPGLANMKANTAIAFILIGLSLLLIRSDHNIMAGISAGVVTLIGLSTLSEYIFGWELGIDELIFKDIGSILTYYPGRMAIMTSFNFSLLGIGALFLVWGYKKISDPIFLLVLINGLMAFLGYIQNVQEFYKIGGTQITAMALHTAVAFIMIAFGLLSFKIEKGPLKIFASNGLGGKLLRQSLWKIIVLVIVLSKIIGLGVTVDFYTESFAMVAFAVVVILITNFSLYFSAQALEREEFLKNEIQFKNEKYLKERDANLLKEKNALESMNKVMVGRELKMIELKNEIEELKKRIG